MAGVATIGSGLPFTHGKILPTAILAGHTIRPSHVHEVLLTRFFTRECIEQAHDADGTVGILHGTILLSFEGLCLNPIVINSYREGGELQC